jgi:hypothetical protein
MKVIFVGFLVNDPIHEHGEFTIEKSYLVDKVDNSDKTYYLLDDNDMLMWENQENFKVGAP